MTAEINEIVRVLLTRAILTLGAIPDPDLRFRAGPRTAWPPYVQETRDAYASAPPAVRSFKPTGRDVEIFLEVLSWLAWFRQRDPTSSETAQLFTARVVGAPIWMLQERATTNRRRPASKTHVYRRLDGLVAAIAKRFQTQVATFRIDKWDEWDLFRPLDPQSPQSAESDLRDLPTSPKFERAPDAKPYGFSHPEAAAARRRERESVRSGEAANRRFAHAKTGEMKKTSPDPGNREKGKRKQDDGTRRRKAKRGEKTGPRQSQKPHDAGDRKGVLGRGDSTRGQDHARHPLPREDRGDHRGGDPGVGAAAGDRDRPGTRTRTSAAGRGAYVGHRPEPVVG